MKRFVVIGLGTFGAGVAEALHEEGNEVIAVDANPERVDRVASDVTRAAVGDGRDADFLAKIGAEEAYAGIVSTGDDLGACVLATMALRDLAVQEIYVKVISNEHARIMNRIGVTETIFPERESSMNLAVRISQSNAILKYVRLGAGFSLQEMAVPNKWNGKTLRELNLRAQYGISVIAVHDVLSDQMKPVPDPDAQLKDSDTLLVAGSVDNLARVARID